MYSSLADAGTDLFRSHRIGPLAKWVGDHIFFRILLKYLPEYNCQHAERYTNLAAQGQRQDGGRLWYGGTTFPDSTLDEHVKNCQFPCLDLSTHTPHSIKDQQYSYNFDDIDKLSNALGIPWERSKDMPFTPSTKYIRLQWDLQHLTVFLTIQKKAKYIANINEWLLQPTHILNDVQKLYGRLLHASLVIPSGRAYLTGLESMLGLCNQCLFIPYSPVKGMTDDLHWWLSRLNQPSVSRPIPAPHVVTDPNAFSDASSGVSIAIIINKRCRAWRLIPGWQTLDGARDIGWAEAVGFKLLVRTLTRLIGSSGHFRVYGDNKGVVKGWWNNRSKSKSINNVFRQIHSFLKSFNNTISIHTAYIPSKSNLADAPSRGIYPPPELILPDIQLLTGLNRFIVDSTHPYTNTELCLFHEDRYPHALTNCTDDAIRHLDSN